MKTLDWENLRAFVAERQPAEVSAGILNDWYWTAATVYENGEWLADHGAYVTSSWAEPGFKATLPNGDVVEVYASVEETAEQADEREKQRELRRGRLKELVAELEAEKLAKVAA